MTCLSAFVSIFAITAQIVIIPTHCQDANTLTPSLPYATLDSDLFGFIEGVLPSDYELDPNIYTWNVSEMVRIINESTPGIWYSAPSQLFALFPDEFLSGLPPAVLAFHGFWCLIDVTVLTSQYNLSYNELNCTNATGTGLEASCFGTLVETDRYIRGEACAVRCEYWSLVIGFTDSTQNRLTEVKTVLVSICVVLAIILLINAYNDWRESKQLPISEQLSCCERPFLQHCVVILTISNINIIFSLFIVELIGRDRFMCLSNDGNGAITSMENPKAGGVLCALVGINFYVSILLSIAYCAAFAVSLWATFYFPLRTQWEKNSCINLAFMDKFCLVCIEGHEDLDYTIRKQGLTEHNECCSKDSYRHCIYSFLGNQASKFHIIFFTLIVVFVIIALIGHCFLAFPPLGLCMMGTPNMTVLFWLLILPFWISTLIIVIFFPFMSVLMYLTARRSGALTMQNDMGQLHVRLVLFFIGQLVNWVANNIIASDIFYRDTAIRMAVEERIKCSMLNDPNECFFGTTYNLSIIYAVLITMLTSVATTMSLSMHSRAIERWRGWLDTIRTCNRQKVALRQSNIADTTALDQSHQIPTSNLADYMTQSPQTIPTDTNTHTNAGHRSTVSEIELTVASGNNNGGKNEVTVTSTTSPPEHEQE